MSSPRYFGKYRSQGVDVRDPEERGRIRVMCPKVLGNSKSAWCEPCIPVAGDHDGDFCLPKVGEMVWVEFEEGNPSKPVYSGGWFSQGASPISDYTEAQNIRVIQYGDSSVTFKNSPSEGKTLSLTLDKTGIAVTLRSDRIDFKVGDSKCSLTSEAINKLNDVLGGSV